MESNKHNDELIKRKLADLNAEPRKLNFATVHANYEKAKETSSNKWGIYAIVGAFAIAVLVTTYALLMPNSDTTVAQTNSIVTEQPTSDANTITSVGTSTEDKFIERSNSEIVANNNTSTEETSENNSTNNSSSSNESAINENNTIVASNKADNNIERNVSTKKETSNTVKNESSIKENNTVTNKITKKTETNISANNKTKIASKVEKNKTNNDTSNDRKKEELASNTKSNDNVPITRSGSSRGLGVEKKKSSRGKKDSQISKDLLANNSDNNQSANKGGENLKSENNNSNYETTANNSNKESNSNADKSSETSAQDNTTINTETKNVTETAKVDSVTNKNDVVAKVDTASADAHIPGVIGTGSVSPRNKHKWLVGAEVSYNSIAYNTKENPNSPAQFSTGDPAFSSAYANAVGKGKHSLITGAISLGYLYNEKIGVTAGLSYFNVKNTFSVGTTSTPVYTTALDYYVWSYVMDTTLNTLTYQIVDTVYKQVPSGNAKTAGTTVNGDSVSTATFENNIRYVSIPLNLSYNFKLGAKFSIEPQAGIIYTMPLRSNHLVATDAYAFNYGKQKADLRKDLYFNTALKLGYNISNKMQVYVRGGYFFRNQSVYNADQPILMSLKSIYTSFGMTFRIK